MTSLQAFVENSGIDYLVSSTKPDEYNLNCPFCEDGDVKHHLGVNVKKGVAYCFRCHWSSKGPHRTANSLAKAFQTGSVKSLMRGVRRERVEKKEKRKAAVAPEVETAQDQLPEEYESFTGKLDRIGLTARRYLQKRGVSLLQMVRHRMGYAACGELTWRVLFPVISDSGVVKGCVGRALLDTQSPRYLNTAGTRYLWNAQHEGSVVVLSEGIMDALRIETALLEKGAWISAARLGSDLSHTQYDQLRKFDQIVVFPDADSPGIRGAMKLSERCADMGLRVSTVIPECINGTDPGSMTESCILEALAGALPWRRETQQRLRAALTRYSDL